ncbi:hypothetical protein FZC68_01095 [Bacillus pumilus]|uniref:Uncharacterized protein n=1 Tax=Bacillus pumilus TaxID=1408 RepID=A0AAD0MK69_BACPU|nr:hypothetical protein C5695_04950 [Bacillus pumilus]TYS31559.1 hypothetical protein FZC65_12065 [Bacillus pumilus]TYS44570.1 hypothetical protein FZC68_01095 [Bacillus pumilus]TYS47197.1 hypothetical protein FZC67_11635 [Bacillus pumilus]
MSDLRSGAHDCSIRSAPVLVLPILQRFSKTLKRRQKPLSPAAFFIHRRKGRRERGPLLR